MSKPILNLHIGPHKTGTTTIQKTMVENRDLLAKNGILYPRASIVNVGHHGFVGDAGKIYWYQPDKGGLAEIREEILEFGGDVIISAETFAIIKTTGPLEKIRDTFSDHFDFRIIPYLRRQDSRLISFWKTLIMMAETVEPFEAWARETIKTDISFYYDKWLSLFEDVFGREAVHPQIYSARNDQLAQQFLAVCGYPDVSGLESLKPANVSATDFRVDLFQKLVHGRNDRAYIETFLPKYDLPKFLVQGRKRDKSLRVIISSFLKDENIDQSGSIYTQEFYTFVMSHFEDSNTRIAQKYFGGDRVFAKDAGLDFRTGSVFERLSKSQLFELTQRLIMGQRLAELEYPIDQKKDA